LPVPTDTTAHHGASARLAEVSKHSAIAPTPTTSKKRMMPFMGATLQLANVCLLAEGPFAYLTYINVTQLMPVFVFNFAILLLCVALIQFNSIRAPTTGRYRS
jgi:hypothetical protein